MELRNLFLHFGMASGLFLIAMMSKRWMPPQYPALRNVLACIGFIMSGLWLITILVGLSPSAPLWLPSFTSAITVGFIAAEGIYVIDAVRKRLNNHPTPTRQGR
jgi:uncharacterized iron-regulated membrane protein